jgi:hypothetical protein
MSDTFRWNSVLNDWRSSEPTFDEAAKSLVAHVNKWLKIEGSAPAP